MKTIEGDKSMTMTEKRKPFYKNDLGNIIHRNSLEILSTWEDSSVDLIMTSPPYAKKVIMQSRPTNIISFQQYC
jgi:DNA modification methylase